MARCPMERRHDIHRRDRYNYICWVDNCGVGMGACEIIEIAFMVGLLIWLLSIIWLTFVIIKVVGVSDERD